jgi:hypothetical protein
VAGFIAARIAVGRHAMSDSHLELADPAIQKVLGDIPTMQRWEILRRTQRAHSVDELA